MKNEKLYTILFGKDTSDTYLYLTRYYTAQVKVRNYAYSEYSEKAYKFENRFRSKGNIKDESFSYELIRRYDTGEKFHWFTLDEANRIMKKLRKYIRKRDKRVIKERKPISKYERDLMSYAYGKNPFIVKKTKISQYLTGDNNGSN